jgi:hypothetical protein
MFSDQIHRTIHKGSKMKWNIVPPRDLPRSSSSRIGTDDTSPPTRDLALPSAPRDEPQGSLPPQPLSRIRQTFPPAPNFLISVESAVHHSVMHKAAMIGHERTDSHLHRVHLIRLVHFNHRAVFEAIVHESDSILNIWIVPTLSATVIGSASVSKSMDDSVQPAFSI